jgi:hypothetical protein
MDMDDEKEKKWKNVNIPAALADEIRKRFVDTGLYTSVPRFIEIAIREYINLVDLKTKEKSVNSKLSSNSTNSKSTNSKQK